MAKKLPPKQERFVAEYLKDLNATQAAIRAGYSKRTAEQIGHQLLKKTSVAAEIAVAQQKRAERCEVSADRVLAELAKIGFSDVRQLFTDGGSLRNPADLTDQAAAAISSIEISDRKLPGEDGEVERVTKIRVWDKVGALTQIGRHLGMFTDKLAVEGDLTSALHNAWKRVNGRSG